MLIFFILFGAFMLTVFIVAFVKRRGSSHLIIDSTSAISTDFDSTLAGTSLYSESSPGNFEFGGGDGGGGGASGDYGDSSVGGDGGGDGGGGD